MFRSGIYKGYCTVKAQYPDHLVLARVGDFYEAFDDDAKMLAEAAGLVLTSVMAGGQRRPLCGLPYHAVEAHVRDLIAQGIRVAVIDPSQRERS